MLDALTLDQLRIFAAVAETGSFRGAARKLSRVQSAVSHSIANLEAQLSLKLFDRSAHRPSLTPEGEALLADARKVLLNVDAMRARARGIGEGVEIELAIVVDTLFPLDLVSAAAGRLRESFPQVCISIAHMPLGGPPEALLSGRAMLGLIVGDQFEDPRLIFEWLGSHDMLAVAAASHPLAASAAEARRLSVAELADHLQIVLEDPTSMTEGRDFGVLSPDTWRVDSQQVKHALIRAGVGWGRLPLWQVGEDLTAGRLVRLRTSGLGPHGALSLPTYFAHRIDRPLGPVARAFRDTLIATVGEREPAGR
jgi:DNA-binding transcriptional LysR family regulator